MNVVLNLFWIPQLGGRGAALATLVSYASVSLFALVPRQSRGVAWMALHGSLRPALAMFAAIVVAKMLTTDPWIGAGAMGVAYPGFLILFGELTAREVGLFKTAMGK